MRVASRPTPWIIDDDIECRNGRPTNDIGDGEHPTILEYRLAITLRFKLEIPRRPHDITFATPEEPLNPHTRASRRDV
jgi:hypothetical protein